MNKARWLFEGWQIRLDEEARVKSALQIGTEAVKAFQSVLVSVLGVNLEPITEPDPDKPGEFIHRWPKEGEFTPLIMAIARQDYIASAMEKIGKILPEIQQETNGDAPDQLATEEDLEFFDALDVDERAAFWNSTEMQQQLKQYVVQADPSTVDPLSAEQPKPVGITDADRVELMRQRNASVPSKLLFQIDDDLDEDLI